MKSVRIRIDEIEDFHDKILLQEWTDIPRGWTRDKTIRMLLAKAAEAFHEDHAKSPRRD